MQRHLVLGCTVDDRLDPRGAADVGDCGSVADQRLLLGGLDHPHAHRRPARVDEFRARQRRFELCPRRAGDVVELDADPATLGAQRPHRDEEVVRLPVGVGEVAGEAAPPRPAVVEIGADDRVRVVGDDEPVVAAEAAVHVVREVVDVVDGGEQARVDRRLLHPPAESGQPPVHLLAREGRGQLPAVAQREQARTIENVTAGITRGSGHDWVSEQWRGTRLPQR